MDYIFRWLNIRFPVDGNAIERHPAAREAQLDLPRVPLMAKDGVEAAMAKVTAVAGALVGGFEAGGAGVGGGIGAKDRAWVQETDAPPCHECGTLMVRNGACHKCPNCGSTSGCS
jgi:ribonucleoside-diphosphate reductase alpha chain